MRPSQEFPQVYSTQTYDRARAYRVVVPAYRVGERFSPGVGSWPEGAQFACGPGHYELALFHAEIRADVVDEVRRGPAEFALIVQPQVIVLAYRFGELIPWQDIPYSWHLQPPARQVIPPVVPSPEARSLLWITLVGARDGIIHAQRGMTLSPSFTRALQNAIGDQAAHAFDPEGCTGAISSIYLGYPQTVDRLSIATARTMGNA
jgi:hypothetical protein